MRRHIRIVLVIILAMMIMTPVFAQTLFIAMEDGVALPILIYHHLDETGDGGTTISLTAFEEQMEALAEAGYEAVSCAQVVDYVQSGTPLPEQPVLITLDDGYTSNLELAAPVLQRLGLRATVFIIGINVGCETRAPSGEPLMTPRFSFAQAEPWVESGVIELQSHTYDLHQLASSGYGRRDGMLRLTDESPEDYADAVLSDLACSCQQLQDNTGNKVCAVAYPFGYYSDETESLLTLCGIPMSLTVDHGINRLIEGDTNCLRLLRRINVTDHCSGAELILRLAQMKLTE